MSSSYIRLASPFSNAPALLMLALLLRR
jgi:hypothetical protein